MSARGAFLRLVTWVSILRPRAAHGLAPPLLARCSPAPCARSRRPVRSATPSLRFAWCCAALPERLLRASTSPATPFSRGPFSYAHSSYAPKPLSLPSQMTYPGSSPLLSIDFIFLFPNHRLVMTTCLAEAEPEAGYLLLAGKYPVSPSLPSSYPGSEIPKVDTREWNQTGSALLPGL